MDERGFYLYPNQLTVILRGGMGRVVELDVVGFGYCGGDTTHKTVNM